MRTDYGSAGPLPRHERWKSPFRIERSPQMTAWAILWSAFAVFSMLLAGGLYAAKEYYDRATLPGSATLELQDGIVLLRDAVTSAMVNASNNMPLRERDQLILGQGARASISLFDGTKILLYPGTTVRVRDMRSSRFHASFSHIGLHVEAGSIRVLAAEPSTETRHLVVSTRYGNAALNEGSFGVQVSDGEARVASRWGAAAVWSEHGVAYIDAGQKALLGSAAVSGPLPEGDQLVTNGDFAQGYSNWKLLTVNEQGRPVEAGQRALVTERINGRELIAMRAFRVSPSGTHNETGLSQVINKDVSDYQALLLSADVRVDDQSLSGGGYLGYEYPVIIRVRYRSTEGDQIDWSHGFFFQNPENRPTPNGQLVPRGQWVAYDGNLMQLKDRPAHIIAIEVLGAGHTFDGMIANVSLIGK
jgi:hypothetical protein